MRSNRLIVAAVVSLAPCVAAAGANSDANSGEPSRRFTVALRVLQIDADAVGSPKVSAEPSFVATSDRKFSFRSGGEVPLSKTKRFNLGVVVVGKVSAKSLDEVDVDARLILEAVRYSAPEKIEQVSRSIDVRRTVRLGRTETIDLEDRLRVELKVDEFDPNPFTPPQAAQDCTREARQTEVSSGSFRARTASACHPRLIQIRKLIQIKQR